MPKRYAYVTGSDDDPNCAMTEFTAILEGNTITQVCVFNNETVATLSFDSLLQTMEMTEVKST